MARIFVSWAEFEAIEAEVTSVTGIIAATEGADSASLVGDVLVVGSIASIEGSDSASLVGGVLVTGAFTGTEGADAASFAGTVVSVTTGSLSATENADAASLSGNIVVQGALAGGDGADAAAFAGLVVVSGSLVATEEADAAALAGNILVQGAIEATDGADAAALTGSSLRTGSLAAVEGADGAEFAGAVVSFLYLRPNADAVLGGWTNEVGGAVLATSLDETAANDDDYIQSSPNPVSDVCRLALSNPTEGITTPVNVRYRYRKEGPATASLTVRLYEGGTVIAEWVHADISDGFVTTTQTLTQEQFDAIGNFTDLFIELEAEAA